MTTNPDPAEWAVRRRLHQIDDSAQLAAAIVERCRGDSARFVEDPIHRAAGMQAIGQIGEAVHHLPDDFRDTRPQGPWRLIRAMRNRISRGYDAVDPEILWNALSVGVPELVAALRPDLDGLDGGPEGPS